MRHCRTGESRRRGRRGRVVSLEEIDDLTPYRSVTHEKTTRPHGVDKDLTEDLNVAAVSPIERERLVVCVLTTDVHRPVVADELDVVEPTLQYEANGLGELTITAVRQGTSIREEAIMKAANPQGAELTLGRTLMWTQRIAKRNRVVERGAPCQ